MSSELKRELSCIIADNHAQSRSKIIEQVTNLGLYVVDTPVSGDGLIESVAKFMPDLIITGILLDRTDGITACEYIKRQGFNSPIIIISRSTLSAHYSAAFELDCIDYINLPLPYERFERAIMKAKKKIEQRKTISLLEKNSIKRIKVKHRYHSMDIDESCIIYVEKVDKRKFEICLTEGRIVETSSNLEQIQAECSASIMRPHRSFLVNLDHIRMVIPDPIIQGNYLIVYPTFAKNIPLTRRNYEQFVHLTRNKL
ncbi:response regulator [Paenibacillus sp. N3/727]|uniref:LytR/AlgR family response regulator transcription factor n=1 Tax=Paenibacillus sp. N3/727 TaxID=2925845 RepID=UPI001F53BC32|nr:response regulator [Paenibacillus sp. N3/727]UNK20355.1 response regulator [Paenibacillus sp. N3/727]